MWDTHFEPLMVELAANNSFRQAYLYTKATDKAVKEARGGIERLFKALTEAGTSKRQSGKPVRVTLPDWPVRTGRS